MRRKSKKYPIWVIYQILPLVFDCLAFADSVAKEHDYKVRRRQYCSGDTHWEAHFQLSDFSQTLRCFVPAFRST